MTRIAYVAGAYVNQADALVHIEDRGYQFADGVYEYFAFYNRIILDEELHWARLLRSLEKLAIPQPMSARALALVAAELIARNPRRDGGLYLQVTRGVAKRDHPFPKTPKPVLVMTVCGAKTPKASEVAGGVAVITHPDHRWERCDVKSVALLANVLAKQQASEAGAREAWLYKGDQTVTEGAVSNAYIVTAQDGIVTHPESHAILGGVTRNTVLRLARENGIRVSERPFTLIEARAADEAFITSTSANVLPVTRIDGAPVGDGKPGPVTQKLLAIYLAYVRAQTGREL